jgi:UDP-N-acetylmuramoyl-L-alanyl-D-glutamate--2,6-diaminopimelate ligase
MRAPGPWPGPGVSSEPVTASFPPVALSVLADGLARAEIRGDPATPVVDVVFDPREVTPGCLFFCVPGERMDGHAFAREAAAGGAVAFVVERWLDDVASVPQLRVPSVRGAMGPISARVAGEPARAMTMVGITGTNGKTTTTYLLEAVFVAAGLRPGVIGTTGARLAGDPVALARTTPEAPDLHRLLARMRGRGVEAVAVEVSSHALAFERVGGLVFDVAAFTNLSQDHLDLHGSMETYFAAKARLFTPGHARRAIVNVDDAWGRRLLEEPSIPLTTIAIDGPADLQATDVQADAHGLTLTIDGLRLRSHLRGRFNASNVLAAVAVARSLEVPDVAIAEGIAAVRGVPGRVEPVEAGQNFLVVVDYAHTPDSIHSVLQAARPLTSGRLIVVFGCGGDRDRAKRPRMGAEATSLADLTVLTSDNPRSEDPLGIIAEIEVGAREGGGDYLVEPDRRAAIELAVEAAGEGDVVVIAGKGHETYQELADLTVEFDDREVAATAIRAKAVGR